ncbi:MAG: hypothetical protein WA005_09995 [Candidatus Binataceae bacterium]
MAGAVLQIVNFAASLVGLGQTVVRCWRTGQKFIILPVIFVILVVSTGVVVGETLSRLRRVHLIANDALHELRKARPHQTFEGLFRSLPTKDQDRTLVNEAIDVLLDDGIIKEEAEPVRDSDGRSYLTLMYFIRESG